MYTHCSHVCAIRLSRQHPINRVPGGIFAAAAPPPFLPPYRRYAVQPRRAFVEMPKTLGELARFGVPTGKMHAIQCNIRPNASGQTHSLPSPCYERLNADTSYPGCRQQKGNCVFSASASSRSTSSIDAADNFVRLFSTGHWLNSLSPCDLPFNRPHISIRFSLHIGFVKCSRGF